MTACTNHGGGKARRVVTAALVGVLSVGTVPMVALATEASDGVTPMFVTAEGAFENAKVNVITFSQGGVNVAIPSVDKDGDYQFDYERNHGVRLEAVELSVADGVTAHPDFTVDASDEDSQFDIQYFERGADGKETGSALTGDVVDAGEYVIVITAKAGSEYGEGAIRIPFDINALDISSITLKGETESVYDAEAKDITFWMDVDGDGTADQLYDPTDIEVKWVKTGADATEDNQYDSVVDSGTYKALVTAAEGSNYKGSVVLDSMPVEVKQLKLDGSDGNVPIPSIVSSSDALPTAADLDGIYIEGAFHGKDSAIMQELKLSLDDEDEVWYENGMYDFNVTKSDPNNENIDLKYDSINAH